MKGSLKRASSERNANRSGRRIVFRMFHAKPVTIYGVRGRKG
ncbi:hypothetical protein [Candidatus Methanodesulfokora washburnensis]|nr:hypothetical protein [Candidatus Methanodesulfokores washburnensis]